jgi:hypothetical protein
MPSITTINSSDVVADSRAVINTNFSNLNTAILTSSGLPWVTWTPPVNGDFAWVNQGGASVAERSNPTRIYLSAPATSGNSFRIRKKSAPTAPYSVTAWLYPQICIASGGNPGGGLCFRNSSDGKLLTMQVFYWGGSGTDKFAIAVYRMTNATTWSSTQITETFVIPTSGLCLRLARDGSNNLSFQYSFNGEDFSTLYTEAVSAHLSTADEVGWFFDANDASNAGGMVLASWAEA